MQMKVGKIRVVRYNAASLKAIKRTNNELEEFLQVSESEIY